MGRSAPNDLRLTVVLDTLAAVLVVVRVLLIVAMFLLAWPVTAGADRADVDARCRYPESDKPWPVVVDAGDAKTVTPETARRLVAAFQDHWRRKVVPVADVAARELTGCMQSDRGYYLRRVPGKAAARGPVTVLWGESSALKRADWVWELQFGGWVDTRPPNGALGGFLDKDERLLVAVRWREG